jgi:hypothetical protein
MHTLNHALEEKVLDADGRYLDAQDLRSFEQYAQGYATRLQTYQNLAEKSHALVIQALRKLAQSHPELLQKHGQRCQYDMTEVLRYMALSVLRDDEILFKEQMMAWLDTILLAHKKQDHCATAYRHLLDAINASLPPTNSTLLRPYFDYVITTLQSHA